MMIQDLLAEANIWSLIFLALVFVLFLSRRRKAASRENPKQAVHGDSHSAAGK